MTSMIATTLTVSDRCDRCGAQAFVRATMAAGTELLFCGHHGREYEAGRRAADADIYWEPDRSAESVVDVVAP